MLRGDCRVSLKLERGAVAPNLCECITVQGTLVVGGAAPFRPLPPSLRQDPAATPMSHPFLLKLQRIGSLSVAEARDLEEAASRTRVYGADEDIVSEGDHPAECHVILTGFACRYKLLAEGKRQILSFQVPGDFCDLEGFVLGRMDHSVGTLTRCTTAVVPHKSLLEITERHPRIARALWADMLVDAAVFREWLASIGRRSAYQRVAHLLCEVTTRLETVGLAQGGSFDVPVTQTELGDALGLSTVHVNRVLQQLRREGLITFRGNALVVHHWERLKTVGDFDPAYLRVQAAAGEATA